MRVPPLPRALVAGAARGAGRLSKRLGQGGGTSIPGLILTRLRPQATAEMALAVPNGVVLVSGTNGKTTTARLVRAALDASGAKVASNTAGANLERGVATALLHADGADVALFEADEAVLPKLIEQTRPRVVTLMNLFRDQLDRFGELEHLADRWQRAVAGLDPSCAVVYNADDPAVAEIAAAHPKTVSYGIDDPRAGRDRLPHAADSNRCRRCGVPLAYDLATIAHLGRWSCPECGLRRVQPDVRATRVELHGLGGQRLSMSTPEGAVELSLRLPGMHNSYNALAATATAWALGLDGEVAGPAMAKREAAFGRAERIQIGAVDVITLLAKNPAGANENLRTMLLEDRSLQSLQARGPGSGATHLQAMQPEDRSLHALVLLNDRTADGQDVSWIWDVDYELLLAGDRLASLTVGGDRAYDMALRFRYAGVDSSKLSVVPGVPAALDAALEAARPAGKLYALPTYTALLELRAVLAGRGLAPAFWEDQ